MTISRLALVRFAAPFRVTPKHLLGQPKSLPESLLGSKLALVLHEIARSDLARSDAKLRALADHALAGYTHHGGKDVFVQIRDRLNSRVGVKRGGYDRASKLATMFNWHKVAGGLDFDRVLSKWITTNAKDQGAVARGEALRHTAHVYGHGYEATARAHPDAPSPEHRERVLEAMRQHVARELKGLYPAADVTRDAVLRSLNRLAWGEHARETLTTHPAIGPKTNVTRPDPPAPAYYPTATGPRANPKRLPEQFSRPVRYALGDKLADRLEWTGKPRLLAVKGAGTAFKKKFVHRSADDSYRVADFGAFANMDPDYPPYWQQLYFHDKYPTLGAALSAHPDARPFDPGDEYRRPHMEDLTADDLQDAGYVPRHGAGELDWRPNEVIPEDFYAMSRRRVAGPRVTGSPGEPPTRYGRPADVDYGIAHASHDRTGRPDPDGAAGVLAERSAVLHAMNTLGLVPPRETGESPEHYAARMSVGVAAMTTELRDHVRDNAFEPKVQHYLELARAISAPRDEFDPAGRIALPDAAVSTLGLSAALAPMVARIAEESGLRPGRYPAPGGLAVRNPRRVRAELVEEPVRPLPGGDLADPPNAEDYAAELFHELDRSHDNRALWGSAPPPRPPASGAGANFDFALPEVAGLPATTPALESVKKAPVRPRKPAMSAATRRAVYRTIAEHLDGMGHVDPKTGAHVPPEESVVAHVQARHGLTPRAAKAAVAAYHKANGSGGAAPAPQPTERVWPPTPRHDRLSRRGTVRRYAEAPQAPRPVAVYHTTRTPPGWGSTGSSAPHTWFHVTRFSPKLRGGRYAWERTGSGDTYESEALMRAENPDAVPHSHPRAPHHGKLLDPHELWAFDLPGGEPVVAPEADWRPNEVLPEDFYAMSRSRRSLVRLAQSFCAPPGGMVARGTFYKGGQRIPSVGGEFMKSGRRRKKRKPRKPSGA